MFCILNHFYIIYIILFLLAYLFSYLYIQLCIEYLVEEISKHKYRATKFYTTNFFLS